MASDDSPCPPEWKTVLEFNDKLTTVLSTDPLSVARTLVAKRFISSEVQAEMLLDKTPGVKATILVEAVRNKIKVAPGKFEELLHILSDQSWTKEIAEALQSEPYISHSFNVAGSPACTYRCSNLIICLQEVHVRCVS